MIVAHRGSGSGGYLGYVFRSAAKELFNPLVTGFFYQKKSFSLVKKFKIGYVHA